MARPEVTGKSALGGKRVYRVDDVCEIFGISIPTVYRLIKNGGLPQPKKLGGSTYWPASQIDAIIEGDEV